MPGLITLAFVILLTTRSIFYVMAKDPAFLFYTGDFSTGTQFFTDEQVGKYVRLLMAQHQIGHLEEKHMIKMSFLSLFKTMMASFLIKGLKMKY